MSHAEQRAKIASGEGFIAALDQSGGSTPKALRLYGIGDEQYGSEAEMFDLVHAMRARIAQAPAFSGDKVIGAILFEKTMDREIAGKPSARSRSRRSMPRPMPPRAMPQSSAAPGGSCPWPVAAIPCPRSTARGLRRISPTSPPPAAPSSNGWRARTCPASRRSSSRKTRAARR